MKRKKSGVEILIPNKIDFKMKTTSRNEEEPSNSTSRYLFEEIQTRIQKDICIVCSLKHYFFKYILLIMLLQLSHFPPFIPFHAAHTLSPAVLPFSSCPWVIYISSLAFPFPIIFLTSPVYFVPVIYAS